MDKSVNPVIALLVILVFGGLITLNIHFSNQLAKTDQLTLMTKHPDGDVVIQVGKSLYKVNPQTLDETHIQLQELGISDTLGGFAFFSNGDLLIRADNNQTVERSETDVYTRTENFDYTTAENHYLARCNLATQQCSQFSSQLPAFTRTFRLFIDWQTDEVYLADTSRHRIIKLNSTGETLAIKEGFKFPNQLKLIGDILWLSDTNHNRFVSLATDTENFGLELTSHNVKSGTRTWPSDIAQVGNEWWGLIMDSDMKDGRIIRYGHDWKRIKSLNLPMHADPLSLLSLDDRVVITDNKRVAIYQFDLDGNRIIDLETPLLSAHLANILAEQKFYQLAQYSCWAVFFVLLLIGFYFAIKQQADENNFQPEDINQQDFTPPEGFPEEGIIIKPSKAIRVIPYVLASVVVLSTGLMLYLIWSLPPTQSYVITLITLLVACMYILMTIPLYRMSKYQLKITPSFLEVTDHKGFRHASAYPEILWTDHAIKVGQVVLALPQNMRKGIFPTKELKKLVIPRLNGQKKVGKWRMLKYQWKSPDGNIAFVFSLMIVMLIMVAGLRLEEIASL